MAGRLAHARGDRGRGVSGRRWTRGALVASLVALGCGDGAGDAGPAPQPLTDAQAPAAETPALPEAGSAPSPGEQAHAIAGNPRLLLFDLQTALEGVHQTRGSYPSVDELQATDSWALQRAALDAAFDEWTYESDGRSYTLSGTAGGRTFAIHSP